MIINPIARAFYKICERISIGTLHFTSPEGETMTFGSGAPEATLTLHSWSVVTAIIQRGDIGLGETYSEGLWDSPDVEKLILLALKNQKLAEDLEQGSMFRRVFYVLKDRLLRRNSQRGSKKNIAAHYDVGNDFYRLWLDDTMTYSSAIYEGSEPLEQAQFKKYDRLLNMVKPSGGNILEVGCGWGGFAEQAAHAGCDVTGITISPAQHEFATRRLGNKANIELRDYRKVEGKYDGIVSIEMVEAVGVRYWPEYFQMLKSRLNPGGKIAIQAIIVEDDHFEHYRNQSDYIRQYTFPGGMLISPEHITRQAQNVGLKTDQFFRFGLDYARTLREWLQKFNAAEPQIRALGYDEAFLRSWRYYMQICAAAFQNQYRTNVIQVELSHA